MPPWLFPTVATHTSSYIFLSFRLLSHGLNQLKILHERYEEIVITCDETQWPSHRSHNTLLLRTSTYCLSSLYYCAHLLRNAQRMCRRKYGRYIPPPSSSLIFFKIQRSSKSCVTFFFSCSILLIARRLRAVAQVHLVSRHSGGRVRYGALGRDKAASCALYFNWYEYTYCLFRLLYRSWFLRFGDGRIINIGEEITGRACRDVVRQMCFR